MAQGFIGKSDFRRTGFGAILSIILSLQSRCKITSISKNATKTNWFWSILLYQLMRPMRCRRTIYAPFLSQNHTNPWWFFVEFGSARGPDFSWSYRSFCRRKVTSVSKNVRKTNWFSSICVPGATEIYWTYTSSAFWHCCVLDPKLWLFPRFQTFRIFDDAAGEGSGCRLGASWRAQCRSRIDFRKCYKNQLIFNDLGFDDRFKSLPSRTVANLKIALPLRK